MQQSFRSNRRASANAARPVFDALESRQLLATVTVNAAQTLRPVDSRFSGTNLAWWQYEQGTTQMKQMVAAAGLSMFRLPGGSAADDFHFFNPAPYNGYDTLPMMANVVQAAGGDAVVTVDYGSGSPQEAAAMLAYLNAPIGNTTAIGVGQTWSDSANAWQNQDFKTAGYWASLRAAKPLAVDDGLNFLRVNHAAPWNFSDFEIGNEEYATWEADHHSSTGKGGTSPTNYVTFAKALAGNAATIDSDIKIGVDVSPPLKYNMPDPTWTADVLTQAASQGFTPGFLSDHIYVTGLTDQNLLLHSVNDPTFKQDTYNSSWTARASYYRGLLNQKLGATAAAGVQLMATEFNSDINTKQADNLVGGLWVADALGGLMQTEYTTAIQWDLTNGYNALSAPDTTHYGWRQGSDEGLIGTGSGPGPASGAYVPYPTYFAQQLVAKIDRAGSTVLPVTSSDANLSVYATQGADGHVRLLVINKSATSAISGGFSFAGFTPASTATQWQYGVAEDNAQSQTTDGHASLTTATLSGVAVNGLTQSFPAYSMSVIDLTPRPAPPAWLSPSADAVYTLTGNTLSVTAGVVTLTGDPATTNPGLAMNVSGVASIVLQTTDHLGPVSIQDAATVTVAAGGGKVLRLTGLTLGPTATLDLNDNDLLYDYTAATPQAATVNSLIATARAGGKWTGPGLTSSAARAKPANTLGFMEATDYQALHGAGATFDGEALDSTAVVVRYTVNGDANLSGQTDFSDFLRLQTAFGQAGLFTRGDFNNDGTVNFSDFLILQANFGLSTTSAVGTAARAVPTPIVPTSTASLTGLAFDDRNGDGRYDAGDVLTGGKRIFLDLNGDGVLDSNEPSVLTDSRGRFTFANLAAGTYRVRRVFAKGFTASTARLDVTLTSGQARTGLVIGTKKA